MKTLVLQSGWRAALVLAGAVVAILVWAADPSPPAPAKPDPAPTQPTAAKPDAAKPDATKAEPAKPDETTPAPAKAPEAKPDAAKPGDARTSETRTAEPRAEDAKAADAKPAETKPVETKPAETTEATPLPDKVVAENEKGIRLNFRGAPLELVLNHLSAAAGFIIMPETDLRGKVDVWSNQPLTPQEAVDVLNTVLAKNGYTAIRNGRTLTIVSKEDAKKRDIPVIQGSNPDDIPKSEDMVTQIMPIRYINAAQLVRDLGPLIPSQASIAANEGGNAILITDTQANIHRLAEIIKALDTSVASIAQIRVFPLKFADAKALATVVKEVFQTPDTSRSSDPRAQFMARMGRGGGGGGPFGGGGPGGMGGMAAMFGGGGGDSGSGSSGGRPGASRVVATSDERSNSLIVAAPDELVPSIEELVKAIDTNVEDVTELRVFHLKYADPQEMSDLLSNLFPDSTGSQNSNNRGGMVRFGGPGGMMFGGAGGNRGGSSTGQSDRLQKQTRVLAVPDMRTASVVVSASHELMQQIAGMVEQLDSDPAKKKKVFVYSVENTDPQAVEDILNNMFQTQNTRSRTSTSRSNTRQTGQQLNTRTSNSQNNSRSGNSSFGGSGGTSGFGSGGR
jgi:type II secretory pathway component GspD/PulD (secretin)